MCTYKSFFPISPILLIFIALGVIGGCLEEKKLCSTGGKNCNVYFDGPICNIDLMNCKQRSESGIRGGSRCGGYQFTEKPTKYCPDGNECKLRCCPLDVPQCSSYSAVLFDQIIAEEEIPLAILNIEQTCDVITKGKFSPISNEDCENLANYRVCNSFDFIPEEDHLVSQCLLYECEDCLLDEFEFNEEFVD